MEVSTYFRINAQGTGQVAASQAPTGPAIALELHDFLLRSDHSQL